MIDIINKIRPKIYYFLLCSYALFLPTLNNLTTLILILLAIVTLLDYKFLKEFWADCKGDFIILALPFVFILLCLSLLYTQNYENGLKNTTKSLPFLLMPIILYNVKHLKIRQLNILYKLFVLGCTLTVIYSIAYIAYDLIEGSYKKVHDSENYVRYFLNRITYHDLVSKNKVDHSIYFGAYILLAITILRARKEIFTKNVANALLILFFFTLFLLTPIIICISGLMVFSLDYYISSQSNKTRKLNKRLVSISICWAIMIFYLVVWKMKVHEGFIYLFNNFKYNLFITIGIAIVIAINYITFQFYSFKRIKLVLALPFIVLLVYTLTLMFVDFNVSTQNMSNFTARLANNYASASLIKENYILGVGVGDVQDNLRTLYREIRFRKLTFNEHNQYLRFWLSSGILTFIIFVLWIYNITITGIKRKQILLFSTSITLLLFCLTESVFARQMGSSFFMFFLFIFYYSEGKIEKKN